MNNFNQIDSCLSPLEDAEMLVEANTLRGVVIYFDHKLGHGYIGRQGTDYLFYSKDVHPNDLSKITKYEEVIFQPVYRQPVGRRAANVRLIHRCDE